MDTGPAKSHDGKGHRVQPERVDGAQVLVGDASKDGPRHNRKRVGDEDKVDGLGIRESDALPRVRIYLEMGVFSPRLRMYRKDGYMGAKIGGYRQEIQKGVGRFSRKSAG
jgi:hypothetical protein